MKNLLPIEKVAAKIGLKKTDLEFYGPYKAKVEGADTIPPLRCERNLILVTAMTPGKSGEGKTTISIGLSQALWKLKKKNLVVLREPSMGPCFGMKGGATGGGKATIEPSDHINFHFTGDLHAVTYAHNLLSSMLDNSLYFDNPLDIDIDSLTWPRVLDLNDRALRRLHLIMKKKNGETIERDTRFDITVTSEVMAILCLSKDFEDLKIRLGKIIVGFTKNGKPVTAKMLKADGAMAFLLKDAIKPNLVQTSEGTPCLVHGGPFANIAAGTPSLIAIKTAMCLTPYTIVEAGFASDLGAEKFLDIVCKIGKLQPKIAVLIATARAVEENGLENLERHLKNLRSFGLQVVLCINRFKNDNNETIATIQQFAKEHAVPFADTFVFEKGGEGALELANAVLKATPLPAESQSRVGLMKPFTELNFTYDLNDSSKEKIAKICTKIYGAKSVNYSPQALQQLQQFSNLAIGSYVCLAKTQYSFSHDPNLKGVPKDYVFEISEIRYQAGSNFLIPMAGKIMTMPGLPRQPLAEKFL